MKLQNTSDEFHSSIFRTSRMKEGIYGGMLELIHMETLSIHRDLNLMSQTKLQSLPISNAFRFTPKMVAILTLYHRDTKFIYKKSKQHPQNCRDKICHCPKRLWKSKFGQAYLTC